MQGQEAASATTSAWHNMHKGHADLFDIQQMHSQEQGRPRLVLACTCFRQQNMHVWLIPFTAAGSRPNRCTHTSV